MAIAVKAPGGQINPLLFRQEKGKENVEEIVESTGNFRGHKKCFLGNSCGDFDGGYLRNNSQAPTGSGTN